MTCFYCKGNVEMSTTTYMTDYQNCYIIIKNVPCEKCSQCGEEYISGEVLEKIENIIQQVKGMLTEIAVIDFRQAGRQDN
ncbi:MAG: type II toxin-antitoxin system MqsA family antitoxin [Lachnospiraceae bacterium]|nr:type II toxin-antitoxin system MqsA family antitoxin [Lachnospiraceae bacterium]